MTDMSRRQALAVLATAPVAGVGAAQAIAQEATELSGVSVFDGHDPVSNTIGLCCDNSKKRVEHYRKFGLPDWQKDEIKKSARFVAKIDPDIASLRSVSFSRKFGMQRERNLAFLLEQPIENALMDVAREKFFASIGGEWW